MDPFLPDWAHSTGVLERCELTDLRLHPRRSSGASPVHIIRSAGGWCHHAIWCFISSFADESTPVEWAQSGRNGSMTALHQDRPGRHESLIEYTRSLQLCRPWLVQPQRPQFESIQVRNIVHGHTKTGGQGQPLRGSGSGMCYRAQRWYYESRSQARQEPEFQQTRRWNLQIRPLSQSGSTSHPRQLVHQHCEGDSLRNKVFKVGLLQRNSTGHLWGQHRQTTASSKHTGSPGRRQSAKWTHHAYIEEIALAPEKNHLQDDLQDHHVDTQGQNNPAIRIFGQPHKNLWTWTFSAFEQRGSVGSSSHKDRLGLSCVLGLCTGHMEQSSSEH